jgi:hypothetical protein
LTRLTPLCGGLSMYTTAECRAYAEEKLKMGNTRQFYREGFESW